MHGSGVHILLFRKMYDVGFNPEMKENKNINLGGFCRFVLRSFNIETGEARIDVSPTCCGLQFDRSLFCHVSSNCTRILGYDFKNIYQSAKEKKKIHLNIMKRNTSQFFFDDCRQSFSNSYARPI